MWIDGCVGSQSVSKVTVYVVKCNYASTIIVFVLYIVMIEV